LSAANGAARPEEEHMKYLLTFVRDQDRMYEGTDEQMREGMEAWNEFNREAAEAGVLVANEALKEPRSAKTLRIAEDGEKTVTDGPFAETKEQLGGFCLIDCGSLEEAIGWAKKVPILPDSKIEVREVKDLSELGYEGSTPEQISSNT
jgi:hypothetical protein